MPDPETLTPVIFGCAGLTLSEPEREFFRDVSPAGFILFARNIADPEQTRALVAELSSFCKTPKPLILIDQEGGRVARLKAPNWRSGPAAGELAALASSNIKIAEEAVWLHARLMAVDLFDLGITVDCHPVIDLLMPGADMVIGDRSFGSDPVLVARLGRAACKGLLDGGVLPVLKHLPGHGRAGVDSHKELPFVDTTLDALRDSDFVPFRDLSDMPLAMTAHIVFAALDNHFPVTLSADAMRAVRKETGFAGLVMSDDLSMGALGAFGDMATLARKSLDAGVDLLLHCNGDMQEMQDIAGALNDIVSPVGGHTNASLQQLCERLQVPEYFDEKAGLVRLDELLRSGSRK